jgi:hypothetical protein
MTETNGKSAEFNLAQIILQGIANCGRKLKTQSETCPVTSQIVSSDSA